MKNDLRITYPLWQMGSLAILMGLVLVIGLSTTFMSSVDGVGFEFELQNELPAIFVGLLAVFILYSAIFSWKVTTHNKRMPKQRINMMAWKPPQEYMEDDELFQEITKRATKKVYSYFVWVLPLLAGIYLVLPIDRPWMISGIFLVAMGQYWIYYKTIRNYFTVKIDD